MVIYSLIFHRRFSSLIVLPKGLFGDKLRGVCGFTFTEVMVVMAMISILSAIAVPTFASYRERAKISIVKSDMQLIELDILALAAETDRFPDSLAEVNRDGMLDPWGNPYQYLKISGADKGWKGKARKDRFLVPVNSDFDLYSMGPDGLSRPPFTAKHSRDDIVRASDGGYFGPASGF